jgi:tRNA(Ile)-lysidine synthase
VPALAELPRSLRTRVLHAWARELGARPAALSHRHVAALDALVTAWRGQGPTHLPGGILVSRAGDRLACADPAASRVGGPLAPGGDGPAGAGRPPA